MLSITPLFLHILLLFTLRAHTRELYIADVEVSISTECTLEDPCASIEQVFQFFTLEDGDTIFALAGFHELNNLAFY